MKLLNYDTKYLIMQNVRTVTKEVPTNYTPAQHKLLCRIIVQKRITKQFFEFILRELYSTSDWKQLSYSQMYQLIYILNHWNYEKVRI